MTRSSGRYQVGERYVLQSVGGRERVAEVVRAAGTSVVALIPLGFDAPEPTLPGGEWRVEPEERLVRDWAGRFWSVSAHPNDERPGNGDAPRAPYACCLEFVRFVPGGEAMAYRVPSPRWPDALSDTELARMLRRAWDALATDDPAERLRRVEAVPVGLEL